MASEESTKRFLQGGGELRATLIENSRALKILPRGRWRWRTQTSIAL